MAHQPFAYSLRINRYKASATTCCACPLRSQCTKAKKGGRGVKRSEHEELIEAHRALMETAEAKAVYRLRGQTIEWVFADFKEHRGLRRFSGRGLERVRTEIGWAVLAENLLTLHRCSAPDVAGWETDAKPEEMVT